MSYDLMVFESEKAPVSKKAFKEWCDQQTNWKEDQSYDDPMATVPELRAWFLDMIECFPPMNGQLSSEELPEDEASVTDYSIGQFVIYAAFAWSKAEHAFDVAFRLAAKYQIGLYNSSSINEEVWLPDGNDGLVLAYSEIR